MELNNDEITEDQLRELDKLLLELNKVRPGATKKGFVDGDDELMIKAVTEASNFVNGMEFPKKKLKGKHRDI